TFVRGLELVTADGELLRCSPDEEPEVFHCARVNLGALGIVTKVTLQCVPAFRLHALEQPAALPDVLDRLDGLVEGNDHFEFYWLPHTERCSTKENNRTTEAVRRKDRLHTWRDEILLPNAVFGAACWIGRAVPDRIPAIAGWLAGTVGRLELVDRSDRIFCSPRLVHFVEMEYAIPRRHAAEAVLAVRDLIDDRGLRISFPIEVRFVAADDIPLSTAHGRESCYIAVHVHAGAEYEPYFRGVEAIMDRFEGRPHWGKLHFQTAATLATRYPEFGRFLAVRDRLDPDRRFANEYLDRVLGAE
ncbi:MAG TPA: D-arabinono-1,4-lactone oxidase, partial [Acidimicrobiia bacterium]|nr:D-arabinono-1,4-lactone oxidase [Acidimicrobiia bacterium]